jgi:hypothetical protein
MMDPLLLTKVITASVTFVIAIAAGFIELRLNPRSWLNRLFALFFISTAAGFVFYAVYHTIYSGDFNADAAIIIPMLITAQILFNIPVICLVITVFVLEKYEKIALNYKHIGVMLVVFTIMSVGYFIEVPELEMAGYIQTPPIIDTNTNDFLALFVNAFRLVLFVYVIIKYTLISRKVEEATKKRLQLFIVGVIIIVIGIVINLIGGNIAERLMGLIGETLFEVFGLILLDIGIFIIVKGFLIS